MEWPSEIPVMILRNAVLFPQSFMPLQIFEPRYRRMLGDVLGSHRMFAVALQKPGQSRVTPAPVAGLGLVRAAVRAEDGRAHLVLLGLTRVELLEVVRYRPYRVYRARLLSSTVRDKATADTLSAKLLALVAHRLEQGLIAAGPAVISSAPEFNRLRQAARSGGVEVLSEIREAGQVADLVSWTLMPDPGQRQRLLETLDVEKRLRQLIDYLMAQPGNPGDNPQS